MNGHTTQQAGYTEQIIKQVIGAWSSHNKAVTNFFTKYNDQTYLKETAPGRNRAVYLLGHLIAVNDNMLPLFGLGERLFPELEAIFITAPDKTIADLPPLNEIKQRWERLNSTLADYFNQLTTEEWMDRHTAVSKEDFESEPFRNKLNVLISRTNHQSYHLGQLNLLNPDTAAVAEN